VSGCLRNLIDICVMKVQLVRLSRYELECDLDSQDDL